jgi:hypothetical protein
VEPDPRQPDRALDVWLDRDLERRGKSGNLMVETHGPARSWQGRIRDSIHMQTHQSEGGGYVRTALVIDVTGISATAQHRSTYRSGGGEVLYMSGRGRGDCGGIRGNVRAP